jgi:exodeoxyribonuclease-3
MLNLLSWNVNGIRANIKKGFWQSIEALSPDILCIQETKSDKDILQTGILQSPNFDLKFHSCSLKKGYSGVATLSRLTATAPGENEGLAFGDTEVSNSAGEKKTLLLMDSFEALGIDEFDQEGRLLVTKYVYGEGELQLPFTLINGYYPQGGRGQFRIDYKIQFYQAVRTLIDRLHAQGERVMLCGDFNTTVGDIDLARPKENRNTTGCLPEERQALDLFLKQGFVDTFRHFHPDVPDMYSYWDQITRARERNVGWRIDMFLVDEQLLPYVKSATIYSSVMGSDHCPVGIELGV